MNDKNTRIESAKKNIMAGFFSRLVSILIPFVSRTILLRIMEAEYLGLNSLFSSILSVLSLAELGVDSAITYNMYKPLAEGNTDQVCALLNLYKKLYKIIGTVILCVGLVCIPFLNKMINGDIPSNINIVLLFVIFLVNSSIGYFMFAYKRSLLIALQRNDIASNISTIIILLQNVLQIVLYYIFKNFYLYAIVLPICTVVSNLVCNFIANRKYKEYQPYGNISNETRREIKKTTRGIGYYKVDYAIQECF